MNYTSLRLSPIRAVNYFDKKHHTVNNLFIFFTNRKRINHHSLIIIIKQIIDFRKNLFPLFSLVLQLFENFLFNGFF